MPRKTKEEAEKTRARILASALSLFVKKGYEHTTFTDIAARLEMTKGAVYWHFGSKEVLLVALVNEMLEKFRRQLKEHGPLDELTFPTLAETMVARAERLVEDPKGAAFFLLLQTQVKWAADSMAKTRAQLLSQDTNGPYHYFIRAVENDKSGGRVRADVDPVSVAAVCMAIWSGLVRSKIEKFLECDLKTALQKAFDGLWQSIKTPETRGPEINKR